MLSRRDVLLLGLTVIVGGCAGPVTSLYPPTKGAPAVSIWVVDHGWHTGVMLPWETVPSEIWPEREDFTGASYLEVGWGDRDFYQAREPTVGLALKATFWPTASGAIGYVRV